NRDAAWVFVKFMVGVSNPVLTGASSSGTTVTVSSTANLRAGMPVVVSSGTGTFAANTVISSISSATQFVVSAPPTGALSNATVTCQRIWEHASLDATSGNHTAPATSTIEVPIDSTGAFIYRSSNGSGTFSLTDVQLRWQYGINGVADDAVIQVQVFAIEMVYVPQGSFAAGSGGAEASAFTLTTINTATATTVPSGSGGFSGSAEGGYPSGETAPANASWPNGYAAFYCMKYEISQGQYRDFLNTLTRSQQSNRVTMDGTLGRYAGGFTWNGTWSGTAVSNLSTPANRNGLRLIIDPGGDLPMTYACDLNTSATLPTGVNQSDDGEWIGMSQLNWMDGCAYMDWAGLRPMTELEFEKACRGDQAPFANEYAWGSTSITGATGISIGTEGANNETFSNAGANCAYNNSGGVQGPLRVGAFAGVATTREQAGATYYGIMEMSGNLWERVVTIGNADGRGFTGVHGNGRLSANGHANQTSWPGLSSGEVTGASGSGFRGGDWVDVASYARVSDRTYAASTESIRGGHYGFRGVRVFP
ncbi:MAG: SUMF1/EgtB/PvdO family nonheme iron enzyme, partial [Bacteroidetes bacterium]|nr:SUMF1/EgtB/PvdO family nonheme iron enzyme [Bacteroidota bacterium]